MYLIALEKAFITIIVLLVVLYVIVAIMVHYFWFNLKKLAIDVMDLV